MLTLTKSILCIMLGFIVSIILGILIVPFLKKMHFGQKVSKLLNEIVVSAYNELNKLLQLAGSIV